MFENQPVVKSDVLASEAPDSITSMGQALRDDQGDVVVLLVRTEAADFVHNRGEQFAGSKGTVAAQGFNQALFAELFAVGTKGLGDAIGV